MTPADLAWLAGLCEGESCIDLHRGRYPRLRLAMADRDVIARAAALMGCGVRVTLPRPPHQAMWHAEIQGPRAEAILREILPHMGARRSARIAGVLGHSPVSSSAPVRIPAPDRVNS